MDIDCIFLIGRPASGKTFIYKEVLLPIFNKYMSRKIERIDDFPILKRYIEEDLTNKIHLKKNKGFQITDWNVVNQILKDINNNLISKNKDIVIVVEFARNNYEDALKNFSYSLKERTLVLYVWASLTTCLIRNKLRAKNSSGIDDHFVAEDEMNSYYSLDDIETINLKNKIESNLLYGWNFLFINNESTTLKEIENACINTFQKNQF